MRHAIPPFGTNSDLRNLTETSPGDPTGPRFLIEDIYPRVDGGRYAVKRIAGEPVEVWADLLRDGHDVIAGALLWRAEADDEWHRESLEVHSLRDRSLDRSIWHLAQGVFAQAQRGPGCCRRTPGRPTHA